jgi:CRP/FNR family transcriptional regulator, anaerobic regulatory protein
VSGSCFADILSELVDLTEGEKAALEKLEERQRHVRRGAVLQRENEACGELFVMRKGLMMSYVLLDDGSRQILRFHFPGDLLGVSSMIYREAPESLYALSDCVVCPFDRAALAELMVDHPRLSALLLVYCQIERVALTDRLAALGRTSAKQRVAALLLELRNRLRATDRSVANAFALGLTQEEIGDATGLTSVHVNRMLRQLEEEGLIARELGRVTLLDERALARAANYVNRYERLDLGWLPRPN